MKKLFISIFLFFYILYANQLNLTKDEIEYIKNKKLIVVSNEYDYEPYDFNINGKAMGYSIDLIEALLKNTGLKIKYETKPWEQLLEDFHKGKIDLIHTILKTKERQKDYKFSLGYSNIIRNYIIRKNSKDIDSIEELFGKKVGISRAWSEEKFFSNFPQIKKRYYKNIEDKLIALASGEIDAIINSSNVVQYYIHKYNYNNLKISNLVKESNNNSYINYYFATLKDKPHLISIINKAYENISLETIESLNRKWFGILDKKYSKRVLLDKNEEKFLSDKKSINMCIDPDWMPFESFKNGQYIGMSADYFKIFEKKIGIPIKVVETKTWLESLDLGEKRKCDIFSLIMPTPQRKKYLDFTKEYFKTPLVFASEIFRPWVDDFEQIKDKKIGIVKGYAYGEILRKKYPYIDLIEVNNIHDGLTKVEKGELYGFIGTLATVGYHIQHDHIGQIKINGKFKDNWKLGIGTRNDEPLLKDIFNKAIDSLTSMDHQTILNKWISVNIKGENFYELTNKEKEFLRKRPIIKFLVRPARPPFEFVEDGKVKGIALDYINKIGEKLGFKVKFIVKDISLKETYKELLSDNRDFDTLLFSVKNKKRAQKINFGDTFLSYPHMIIVNKNTAYVGKVADLLDKKVAVEEGFLTNKWLKRDHPQLEIIPATNTLEALTMVNNGKADAYVGNMAVANYLSSNKGFEKLKIAAPSKYGTIDYRFVAPKDIGILASILSKGYKQLTPAEHNLIAQKWFSQKTVEKIDYVLIWKIIAFFIFIILWMIWWSRKLHIEKRKTELTLSKLEETKDRLNKQKEEFELIFKYSKDGIAIIDLDTNFLNLNNAYTKITGYSKKEMLKMSCLSLVIQEERLDIIKTIKECIHLGYVENFQKTCIVANEKKVDVNISMSLLPDKNRILIVLKDVSALKLLEEQSKLASMGQMIGNIAHQWRQPLSMITTNASGVKLKIEYGKLDNDYIMENMDSIINQANYLSKTIDNFRNFIKNENRYTTISIKETLEQALSIINASLKNNYITAVLNIEDDLKIEGNINELVESFINLINNSKDALKENIEDEDDRFIFISTNLVDSNILEIKILDSGGGIDNKIINHIFEPYFTTKHQSIGTGLGLSMVDKIIRERHKGMISVYNQNFEYNNKRHKGVCFKIVFKA